MPDTSPSPSSALPPPFSQPKTAAQASVEGETWEVVEAKGNENQDEPAYHILSPTGTLPLYHRDNQDLQQVCDEHYASLLRVAQQKQDSAEKEAVAAATVSRPMAFIALFNELAREIHENAKAKGYWETERNDVEIIALMHPVICLACWVVQPDNSEGICVACHRRTGLQPVIFAQNKNLGEQGGQS
jgi:hypothetical protein